jgi:cyclohexa-1,5-dienecarbonyl-CoA hydratase
MSAYQFIKAEKSDGVARISLARPKHNVLDIAMMNEFNAELDALIADDGLKCVVISGEGPSFCAGVEVGDHKPDNVDAMVEVFGGIFERFDKLGVPTIAAVRGACLGGGLELAIACDIVMAEENAVFGQPEIKLGFFPPYAVIRLPQLIGPAKAIEVCTTGRRYSADEAQKMGFVGHVAAADAFDAAVEKMIKEIAVCSPLIIRLNKQAVRQSLGKPFAEALAQANDYFLNTMMKTEDTLEGIAGFEEKRRPVWKNK